MKVHFCFFLQNFWGCFVVCFCRLGSFLGVFLVFYLCMVGSGPHRLTPPHRRTDRRRRRGCCTRSYGPAKCPCLRLAMMPQGLIDTPSPVRRPLPLEVLAEVETPSPPPPPKRVRLREKTTVPSPSPAQEVVPVVPRLAVDGEEDLPAEDDTQDELPLTPFLKKKFHNIYHYWWTAKVSYRTLGVRAQQRYHGFY